MTEHIFGSAKHQTERMFLATLKNILSDAWYIFCGLKFSYNNINPAGECDFILWHPNKGIAVIELKTGIIQNGEDDCGNEIWFDGNDPEKKNIFGQLRRERNFIRKQFSSQQNSVAGQNVSANYPVTGCAVFLNTPRNGRNPPEEFPTFFKDEVNECFNGHLSKILQETRSKLNVCAGDFDPEFVCKVIAAIYDKAVLLEDSAENEKIRYADFTDSQKSAVELFARKNNGSIRITGGAGTGKTLVAQHFCRFLTLVEHKTVLLLGYNILLNWVQKHFLTLKGICPKNLSVKTIETFSREITGTPAGEKITDWAGFWEKTTECAGTHPEFFNGVDTLIVDEAQLFNEENWKIIRKFKDNGTRLIVFYDEMQNIIHKEKIPGWIKNFPRQKLKTTCRNTPKIFDFIRKNIHNDETELMPWPELTESKNVIVACSGNDGAETADAVSRVENAIRTLNLKDEQTVIIGRTKKPPFGTGFAGRTIISPQNYLKRNRNAAGNFIQYFTAQKFTGCEADYVIVHLPTDKNWEEAGFHDKRWLYTACTRARSRLFLILPQKAVAELVPGTFALL